MKRSQDRAGTPGHRPGCQTARLLALLASAFLAACTVNPVTGRDQLFLISQNQEAQMGAQQNPRVIREFGGVYEDPTIAAYVDGIGRTLAGQSERPDIPFTFTVLDSDITNAFALPGGYVYITRGLLALANDEAEVAGVLAHEIGHVTARHSAERYSQSVLAQLGVGLLGAAAGSDMLAQGAGLGAQAYLSSYSRRQESEADAIGIRYLAAAGYDARAMASFLDQMEREHQLQALVSGGRPQPVTFFSTHPRTTDRAAEAARTAAAIPNEGERGRERFLATVDGMLFGDSPDNGALRGQTYANPGAGIVWRAPRGIALQQQGATIIGAGPGGSLMIFDIAPLERPIPVLQYVSRIRAGGSRLFEVELLDINGFDGATGITRVNTRDGVRDIRLVAVQIEPDRLARFVFITRPETTDDLATAFQRATYSFRPLTGEEARQFRPMRIELVTVQPGDTIERLAALMPYRQYQAERFMTLNGLDPGDRLVPGQRVKIATLD